MSDSSSEEDLSRFQEAVDTTFIKLFKTKTLHTSTKGQKMRSERYLEEAGHYNDVKVSKELQNRIGAKVSEVINRNLKFVDMQAPEQKTQTVEGGIKLFKDSEGLLSCEGFKDTSTEKHNKLAKNIKNRIWMQNEESGLDQAKIKSAVVSGEHVLSKKETKYWKSRRKEKIYRYRNQKGRSNVLISVE